MGDARFLEDALILSILALGTGGVLTTLWFRFRRNKPASDKGHEAKPDLEERVRVLERIATDRPRELAAEIEALRDKPVEAK